MEFHKKSKMILTIAFASSLAGCGGDFKLSGTLSDNQGTIEISNGTETLSLGDSGEFTFAKAYKTNDSYEITVITAENQTCTIANSGNTFVTADISDVGIICDDEITEGYTKLSSTGAALPDSASEWGCVRDNETGLIWEVKTNDEGLRDRDHEYTNDSNLDLSIDTDPKETRPDVKSTEGFAADINVARLCGNNNWRVPSLEELTTIVYCSNEGEPNPRPHDICPAGAESPVIDSFYFPYIDTIRVGGPEYWTTTRNTDWPDIEDMMVHVRFTNGWELASGRANVRPVRLVRGK